MKLLPNEVLHKVRRTAGISQEQLSQMVKIDQASISRIEKGKQSIQLDFLLRLSEIYGLSVEQLVSGTINYYDLANKFGRSPKIPLRYRTQSKIYYREILPIIFFIRKIKGDKAVEDLLESLKISDLFFMAPQDVVSAFMLIDIVKESLNKKLFSKKDIPLLIKEGLNLSVLGETYEILKAQKDSQQLITNFLSSSSRIESFFAYSIEVQNKATLTATISIINDELREEVNLLNLNSFFIKLKETHLNGLINHFNKGPGKLRIEGDPFNESCNLAFNFA